MAGQVVRRALWELEEETLEKDGKVRAKFKMLFSGDHTRTDSLTCGVAVVDRHTSLPRHRHAHAEVYLGLSGEAHVRAGGEEFLLSAGVALFIPGNVEHEVLPKSDVAHMFFAFAADSLTDVQYVYPAD